MLREKIKQIHIKCSIKNREDNKSGREKKGKNETFKKQL